MVERIIAACDGAAKGNPGPAAWAYVVADGAGVPQRWQAGPLGHSTNNIGELTALEQLLTATDPAASLEVRLDSTYTRDAVTKWLAAWKRNGWKTAAGKPVANQELIQRIDALLTGRDVTFVYVPAHQVDGDPLNAIADKAASDAARTQEGAAGTAADLPVPDPVAASSARGGRSFSSPRVLLPGEVRIRDEAELRGRCPDPGGAVPRDVPVQPPVRQGRPDHQGRQQLGTPRVRGRPGLSPSAAGAGAWAVAPARRGGVRGRPGRTGHPRSSVLDELVGPLQASSRSRTPTDPVHSPRETAMTQEQPQRPGNFGDHQLGIYLNGMFADLTPELTTDLAALEDAGPRRARAGGPRVRGAERRQRGDRTGRTARPSTGGGSSRGCCAAAPERDLSCTVLGTPMPAPLLVAPMGVQTLAHPDGELATVRAAAALGVPYVHSTQAVALLRAGGRGGRERAALVPALLAHRPRRLPELPGARQGVRLLGPGLTLDTPVLGWRPADLDRGFLPFLRAMGIANYLTDPAFQAKLAKPVDEDPGAAAMHWAQMFPNRRPGLGRPAVPARQLGRPDRAQGHHARSRTPGSPPTTGWTASWCPTTAAARWTARSRRWTRCPPIADAVGDRNTVLFDSGVRTGADAVKALALGARAVLLGRPSSTAWRWPGRRVSTTCCAACSPSST